MPVRIKARSAIILASAPNHCIKKKLLATIILFEFKKISGGNDSYNKSLLKKSLTKLLGLKNPLLTLSAWEKAVNAMPEDGKRQ